MFDKVWSGQKSDRKVSEIRRKKKKNWEKVVIRISENMTEKQVEKWIKID